MTDTTLRADKWLWRCRFFKSRTLAAKLCASGRLRVNGTIVRKAHGTLRRGDVLTFPMGSTIRVVRVVDFGTRRGPAVEAQTLFADLTVGIEGTEEKDSSFEPRDVIVERKQGQGRPTKADRRAIDRLRGIV